MLTTVNQDPNVNVRLAAVDALHAFGSSPVMRSAIMQSIRKADHAAGADRADRSAGGSEGEGGRAGTARAWRMIRQWTPLCGNTPARRWRNFNETVSAICWRLAWGCWSSRRHVEDKSTEHGSFQECAS